MNHQHLESSFRRYEPLIRQAVDSYPTMYIASRERLDAFGLPSSLQTCVARCRDAINSLLENKWKSDIDIPKLLQARKDNFVVSTGENCLIFGMRQEVRATSKYAPLSDKVRKELEQRQDLLKRKQTGVVTCTDLQWEQIHTICILAKLGALRCPIEIHIDETQSARLEQDYQIAIVRQKNGFYWILP